MALIKYYYTELKDHADLIEYVKEDNRREFSRRLRLLNDARIYKLAQFYKDVNDPQFDALDLDDFNELEDVRDKGGILSKCNLDSLIADNKAAIDTCITLLPSNEVIASITKIIKQSFVEQLFDLKESDIKRMRNEKNNDKQKSVCSAERIAELLSKEKLDRNEVAEILGISKTTLWRLNEIKPHESGQRGKKVWYTSDEVKRYIADNKV